MERVPEPELMNELDQARAYAEADFDEPHSRFIELLTARFPDLPAHGTALDLGCGPGDIAIRFALAHPGWHVDGVDGAPAMLDLGREAVLRADLEDRVRLVEARLPERPPPRDRYDLVLSNSLLHHLEDPMVLWRSVLRWAEEGAPVFVMDLMRPESREVAERLVDEYSAGEPDVLRRDFFHSLLAAYRPSEVEEQLAGAGLEGLSLEITSDRHFIVVGRR